MFKPRSSKDGTFDLALRCKRKDSRLRLFLEFATNKITILYLYSFYSYSCLVHPGHSVYSSTNYLGVPNSAQ